MAEITAALVKELREKTSAGMMDCKTALVESGGEIEAAVDWLRAKGLSAAEKKAGRITSEGLNRVGTGPQDGDHRPALVATSDSDTRFLVAEDLVSPHRIPATVQGRAGFFPRLSASQHFDPSAEIAQDGVAFIGSEAPDLVQESRNHQDTGRGYDCRTPIAEKDSPGSVGPNPVADDSIQRWPLDGTIGFGEQPDSLSQVARDHVLLDHVLIRRFLEPHS